MPFLLHVAVVFCVQHVLYQQVGWPYTRDWRHPENTLFIFCESDFCSHKVHDVAVEDWLAACRSADLGAEPLASADAGQTSASSSARPGSAAEPFAGSKGDGKRAPAQKWRLGVWEASGRAPEDMDFSSDRNNLVCVCNEAYRCGRGNFVWLGWVGKRTEEG